eukprot:scaffold8081_cov65-Phaeocystis_antarctica.AAC.1
MTVYSYMPAIAHTTRPREATRLHASAGGLDARPVTGEQLVALRRADRHRTPLVGRANVVEPPPPVGQAHHPRRADVAVVPRTLAGRVRPLEYGPARPGTNP